MRLISLRLENYRQHKQTELIFPTGLVGILGANGSGKSSILEAIAWAIYGNKAGLVKGGKDTLLWRLAEPNSTAIAELSFVFAGDTFTIKRWQSSSTHKVELQRNNQVIANSIKAVDESIAQLLQMSYGEFFNSYFTGQKDLQFLSGIKEGVERERFIGEMLGYERITQAQGDTNKENTIRYDRHQRKLEETRLRGAIEQINPEQIQQKLEGNSQQISSNQQEQMLVNQQLESENNQLQQLQAELEELALKQREYQQLATELVQLKTSYANSQAIKSSLTQEIAELTQKVLLHEQLQAETADLEALIQAEKELKQAQQNSKLKQDLIIQLTNISAGIANLEAQINAIAANLQKLPALENKLSLNLALLPNLEAELNQLEQRWYKLQSECTAKLNSHQQAQQKINQQINMINSAGAEGNCPTCDRPLHEEFINVMTKFQEGLEEEELEISRLQGQLLSLHKQPERVTEVRALIPEVKQIIKDSDRQKQELLLQANESKHLHKQLADKQQEAKVIGTQIEALVEEYDGEKHQQLLQKIKTLQQKYQQLLMLSDSQRSLQRKEEQLVNVEESILKITLTIENLERIQMALNFQVEVYERTKQLEKDVNARITQLTIQQHNLTNQQQILQRDQQSFAVQLHQYQEKEKELTRVQSEWNLLEVLDRSFTDLRKHLNEQIRPHLSEVASVYLNELTDGRYSALELDDKYNVQVMENGDRKSVISGGEEDIVNLCLRLAISEMIAEGRGHQFSLLILDEVFGSLDDQRRDNVLQLLHRLNDRFEQVLIISHIGLIKDTLNYTIGLEYDLEQQFTKVKSPSLDNLVEL